MSEKVGKEDQSGSDEESEYESATESDSEYTSGESGSEQSHTDGSAGDKEVSNLYFD